MQLKKIQEQLSHFKAYLDSPRSYDQNYIWESQLIFQNNWDIYADDFGAMYEACLQNSQTKRLWKRESYFPKQLMGMMIALSADFVQQMFKDLFDETKAIDRRVDRFIFYCDELLTEYKNTHPRSIENNHYHSYEMCSLYLAFRYPEVYGLYDFDIFKKSMTILGSTQIPQLDDYARYCKVSKTLMNFLKKDEDIFELHQKRLKEGTHYMEESMLLVSEWMLVMGG